MGLQHTVVVAPCRQQTRLDNSAITYAAVI
jgi:hypothetical protein